MLLRVSPHRSHLLLPANYEADLLGTTLFSESQGLVPIQSRT